MKLSLLTFLIFCSISLAAQTGIQEISLSHRIVGKSYDAALLYGGSLTYFRHTNRFTSIGIRSSFIHFEYLNYSRTASSGAINSSSLDLLLRISTHKDHTFVFNSILGLGLQRTNNLNGWNDSFSYASSIPTGTNGFKIVPSAVLGGNLAVNVVPRFTFGLEANLDLFYNRNGYYEKSGRTFSFGTFAAYRW